MKGFYVFFGTGSVGVRKKINMQIHELEKVSDVTLIEVPYLPRTLMRKAKSMLPFCTCGFNYNVLYEQISDPDYLYIRRTTADKDFFGFLSYIRKKYPKCKIIIEIYTYPYDKDDYNRNIKHHIRMFSYYQRDRYYRNRLVDYVDKFITYSDDDQIFGINTIKTCNGVIVDAIPSRKVCDKQDSKLNMIAVAGMQEHHGYERLLRGLSNYYGGDVNRKVVFHLVGEGPEIPKYKKLVNKLGLSNYVIFHGKKIGKDLDDVYSIADIAIGSLGLYKYDIFCNSTLKVGEYLAKGLPIVSGANISTIENEKVAFILSLPNNSSDINIYDIIQFYERLYKNTSKNEVSAQIRKFAYERFDMPIVMKPIIEYLVD